MKVDMEFLKKCNDSLNKINELENEKRALLNSKENIDRFDENWLQFKCGNGSISPQIILTKSLKGRQNTIQEKKVDVFLNFINKMIEVIDNEIERLKEV